MAHMRHILMVKIHNKTRFKYLCKKSTNSISKCFKYNGSGKHWRYHLRKHGADISTFILGIFSSIEHLKIVGRFYSDILDITKSKEWANLKPEEGDGGDTYTNLSDIRKLERNVKISKGVKRSLLSSSRRQEANKRNRERKARGEFTIRELEWYNRLKEIRRGKIEFIQKAREKQALIPKTLKQKLQISRTLRDRYPFEFTLCKDEEERSFKSLKDAVEALNLTMNGVWCLTRRMQKLHRGWRLIKIKQKE